MSLIKCPECGGMLSDMAEHCPHCGYPVKTPENEKVISEDSVLDNNQIIEKRKKFPSTLLVLGALIIAVFTIIVCIPNDAEKDKQTLKECLLKPNTLIIYEAYTNENYDDNGRATLFYFGAENRGGGISDDWALVKNNEVTFESEFNNAKEEGDNQGIIDNADVVMVKSAVNNGNEEWKKANIK